LRGARPGRLASVEDLARLHEVLLFFAAYPPSVAGWRSTLAALDAVARRLEELAAAGIDLSELDDPDISGLAGTSITTTFSYDLTTWLRERFGRRVTIDWEAYEAADRLAATLPRFVPLLEEEALADANVPYRRWIDAARLKREDDLAWLLERFASLDRTKREKAELFDSLALPIRWEIGRSRFSRTRMRRPVRAPFLHPGALLSRRDVSLEQEFASAPIPIRRLSRREGTSALDLARASTASRYREFYGFTYGDPSTALVARPGRGLEIFFFGLRARRRLPLRAGYAALIFKNGIAVAYYEGLAFFERMEAGFNVYYTFREGESAWIYAQVLKLCRQVTGVRSFSIDPYQIGLENEEAIQSGAFWFYRKLGFRPTDPKVAAIVAKEERRMAQRPGYRTPLSTLRRIATCNLLYEVDPRTGKPRDTSDWDGFHIRNIGLAVNWKLARVRAGDTQRGREAAADRVERRLGIVPKDRSRLLGMAFPNWALVLDQIPSIFRWSRSDRAALAAIIRAKSGRDESRYLRLLRNHPRLRRKVIWLGSRTRL
jgi:hypothetical protein